MLTAAELARGSYGAWRLLLGDAGGLAHIDTSPTGMRRSFLLAPLLLPLYALFVIDHANAIEADAGLARIVAVELSAYAIGWTAFPLAMAGIVRLVDREREFDAYVAAYNWSNLVQFALVTPLVLLSLAGALSEGPLQLLGLALTAALFVYEWFIARTALRLPAWGAVALVALEFIIGLFVSSIGDLLIA